jgi:hypothetical protein
MRVLGSILSIYCLLQIPMPCLGVDTTATAEASLSNTDHIALMKTPILVQVVGTPWYDTTFFGSFLGAFLAFLFGLFLLGFQSWLQWKRDKKDRLIELRHFYEDTELDRTLLLRIIEAAKKQLQVSGEPKFHPINFAKSIYEKRRERSKAFTKEWRNLEIAVNILKINEDNYNGKMEIYNDQITLSRNSLVLDAMNQSRREMSAYLDLMKEQLLNLNSGEPFKER